MHQLSKRDLTKLYGGLTGCNSRLNYRMGIKIKQGYPEEVIGELNITDSGWFFYPIQPGRIIHESTITKMKEIIDSHTP